MHTTYRSSFTSIRVEGAILPPDLLQRVDDGDPDIEGLTPEAFHLDKGEKLNEAISRSWNRLLGAWATFRAAAEKLPEADAGTTVTRERWLLPLFQELGYGRLVTAKAIEVEGQSYPISHGWLNTPIHLVGLHVDIDKRTPGVAGAARASPHSLVQVLLNRSDAHLWAFVSNGMRLRILRDNASLTRQAYVEFDLQAMLEGQAYSDFVLLWLLCHQSRVEADRPEECWLEKWSKAAQAQGTRALDQLRDGVQEAIVALGRGFLSHPANHTLRDTLYAGKLEAQDYYRQLLRVVYRLIFLFVAEDRDLLLVPDANPTARGGYIRYYSTVRLRELSARRRGTRHSDLFHGLRLVMEKLSGDAGCPELALPALDSDLFEAHFTPDLEGCEIANHDLLDAIRALALTTDRNSRRAVDYKNLGSEELGSVYESLLELHPILNGDAGTFELRTAGGNERKTTGSFYTPTPLINCLLDSALDPVLDEACRKPNPEQAILALKVCDSAGGSGHIAIAAARRIAGRLAAIRTGEDEPSPEAFRAALRDVIVHSIYVVDVNPMAVELCKVNLWMEMQDPRYPLSFLDAHIKCGNSLIGVTPAVDISEIPDEAFNPVTGDHKPTASALKKRNKAERAGQTSMELRESRESYEISSNAAEVMRGLTEMPQETVVEVQAKAQAYSQYLSSEEYARKKLEYDLWTAAFFWQIKEDPRAAAIVAPTQGELARLRRGEKLNPELVRGVQELAERLRFFHWALEYPEVFEQGGFDVNLSNPPWERIKLQEEEFFAARDPEIATAPNKAARQKLIDALPKKNVALAQEFENAKHDAEATSKFMRHSGRFPLTAVGDVNTYAIFTEHACNLLNANGHTGIIVPSGIATDDTTKSFFQDVIRRGALRSLFEFENEGFFQDAGQGHMVRFCLLTLLGVANKTIVAEFMFQGKQIEDLSQRERHFTLTAGDLALFNPNTQTCPIFQTRADADLTRKIYQRVSVLENERTKENPWGVSFLRMFDMSNDSGLFSTAPREGFVPLYESKMFHQFTHRYGDYQLVNNQRKHVLPDVPLELLRDPNYVVVPYYWVPKTEVENRLGDRWSVEWLIGFRNVTDARASERTVVFSLLPRVGVGNSAPLMLLETENPSLVACLLSNCCSLVFDFVARQKVSGLNLNFFIVKQLPVLPPTAYSPADVKIIAPRVLELVYTAWDMKPFAEDMGYRGEPFRWDEERRAQLRAELDAYYARLYGLTRDELRYILDPKDVYGPEFPSETFRVLKEKEIRQCGEYRTRRLVLEKWDEMFG